MSPNVLLKNLEGGESYQIDVATSGADHSRWVLRVVEREMEVMKMDFKMEVRVMDSKYCESCGEELTGEHIVINPNCFNADFLGYGEGAFCGSSCLAEFLEDEGAVNRIYRKEVNEYEDQQ